MMLYNEYSRKLESIKGAINIFLYFLEGGIPKSLLILSLEWNFIVEVLRAFNFSENFIKWIQILYNESIACVKNNCWQSHLVFKLTRDANQGCSTSALLFI